MKTATAHSSLSHFLFRSSTLLLLVGLLGLATTLRPADSAGASLSYGWPVKPFDTPHPVRGSFGDPRTVFAGPPTQRTLLTGSGSFSFHFGVDVSAPNGTAVYPVESGTVTEVTPEWVEVAGPNGRSFQYWHIHPTVAAGQRVEARVTVLGRIIPPAGHVHLAEFDHGVIVNPLSPGHLGPYADTTRPSIASVAFRRAVTSTDLMPELLRGRVEIVASAYDMPAQRVPGAWRDLPVTPALIDWRVQVAATGRVVVAPRIVYDVRGRLPAASAFWSIYARGTHQNMTAFGKHYSYMQPGSYLFRLAPGGFDTRSLPDGVYEIVVTATDVGGNRGSQSVRFSIHNRPGVVGP